MIHRTRLIVLNTTKIGERSLVLHALSPDWGRRSFITSVPKGGRMALFQPLNILDAEVTENPRSDLWRVHGLSAVHALAGIRTSPAKNAMTLFMSEVLWRTIRDGAREDGLFEWCERAVLTLDALEGDYANYHPFRDDWGCSSVGRAPALQAGGQGFESPRLHSLTER